LSEALGASSCEEYILIYLAMRCIFMCQTVILSVWTWVLFFNFKMLESKNIGWVWQVNMNVKFWRIIKWWIENWWQDNFIITTKFYMLHIRYILANKTVIVTLVTVGI
jgi:hypothetical protein